ncbi:Probable ion channel POLLUX (AtPOLLUX) (Probable ion channel DMI1), partial [Durusdinium trenchii]
EVEDEIASLNTDLGDLKLVVRSGKACDKTDLWKVGADSATRIVIPENPSVSWDESDAATMGILLTLKSQGKAGWPNNGYVAVQCCLGRNVNYMQELYDKTFILSGERLGRIMVQSVQDQGLCSVFNQIIGFSGDEFYIAPAEELGVVGKSFEELPFWFPITVPLGVINGDGNYQVNPEKSYRVQAEDAVILLADDDDAVQPVDAVEPFFDYHIWSSQRSAASFQEANPNDGETVKALICNFNDRNFGCAILFALDEMAGPGSEVEIFCSLDEQELQEILLNAQRRQERNFENIKVTKVHVTPAKATTSMYRLKELPLDSFDQIFILADASQGVDRADEQTVAMVLQMQSILKDRDPEKDFQPMVEICTNTAQEQLSEIGIQNMINTTLLVSKALAMVAISSTNHGVLSDLLSTDGNNLDIMDLQDYLAVGEELPKVLTFAEATAIVARAAQQVLIGWSLDGDFEVNPKNKLSLNGQLHRAGLFLSVRKHRSFIQATMVCRRSSCRH